MRTPRAILGIAAIGCWLVSLAGWALVYGGMKSWFPGGDPGWGNLAAIVWGMILVLVFASTGISFALAALSEPRRWMARAALVANVFSILGIPLFILVATLGAFVAWLV